MEKSIATPKMTKKILKENNIRLNKRMGQNFLIDPDIIDIIIESAEIQGNEVILEVGPGIGSLTEYLLKSANTGKVIAVEKDNRFINILKNQFQKEYKNEKLELINDDVLNINWNSFLEEYDKKVKVLANLPYYITTPVIMGLLESGYQFDSLTFMVQKEVAERMVSKPGTKAFGSLSVAVQYHTKAEIIHQVPSSAFLPSPKVQSAIIKLDQYKEKPYKPLDEEFFFSIVKAIFQQRRKNIKNGLSKAAEINLSKEIVLKSLEEVQIDRRKRGEKLDIAKMVELSNALKKNLKNY